MNCKQVNKLILIFKSFCYVIRRSMKKSFKWLYNSALVIWILLFYPCIVHAQNEKESQSVSRVHRTTDSVYVNPGFYYLRNKADSRMLHTGLIRSHDANEWVVYLPEQYVSPSIALTPVRDTRWKFSPQFNTLVKPKRLKLATRNATKFVSEFRSKIRVEFVHYNSNTVILSCDNPETLEQIYNSDLVIFVDIPGTNAIEESLTRTQDISVNAISAVHHFYPIINGEGLTCSIKENTIDDQDIDLKGRLRSSQLASSIISLHANQMATIIAGGGNTSPSSLGAAWRSEVTSSSFDVLFPDPKEVNTALGVSVQNHSYGTQIENFYGAEARAYDVQTNEDPLIAHVFSSGNKGAEVPESGGFAGVGTYANMTGNFKMAKNVIVAGAHYDDFSVDDRNSRGPAYDGRLKPDVVAFGPDGTSDGAAMVSGVALLIQDAYKKSYGKLPESALVRALLITGADDILQPGIDYRSGYGAVNALSTLRMVQDQNIIQGDVAEGGVFQYKLAIPNNTKSLKLSLTWNDPAAEAGSDRALVNDLDLELIAPDGSVYKPWILSTYPHSDSLAKAPRRSIDKLNNAEMVSIDLPESGEYSIKVYGSDLQGPQRFFLVYHFEEENNFEWLYPLETNALQGGAEINLRWATTIAGTAGIEISLSGAPFEEISSEVDLAARVAKVMLPDDAGVVTIRMKVGEQYFYTDPVTLSQPQSMEVAFNCDDSFMLAWPRSEGATTYQLYALGEKYLEPILVAPDTFVIRNKSDGISYHYAVAPILNGREGSRSLTYDIRSQGVECYFRTLSATPADGGVRLELNLSTLYNVDKIVFQRLVGENIFVVNSVSPVAPDVSTNDQLTKGGIYRYRAEIVLRNGSSVFTPPVEVLYSNESTYLLFPNPVHSSQPLRVLTDSKDVSVTILDLQGRIISRHALPNSLMEFSIGDLLPGVYLYRVERMNAPAASGKLIVLR